MTSSVYILSAIVLFANFMITTVDSVECYSCSSHVGSSECYTGKFELDTIEKNTCSNITTCQKVNNVNDDGSVVTVMRQCALTRCSDIGSNCYECEGDLCNSASLISKSVLLGLSALLIACSFHKLFSSYKV